MRHALHRAAICVGLGFLGACADITGTDEGLTATTLSLLGGEAVARSPRDYCISPSASRPAAGFAIMGRCATASPNSNDGFITLQIGAAGSGFAPSEAEALRQLLQSDAGRGLLSQDGNGAAVRVNATDVAGDTVIVRFQDRGATPVPGLQTTEWRGFFDVNGRLATVSVRGLAAAPLGTDDGEVLLARTIAEVRQANGVASDSSNS